MSAGAIPVSVPCAGWLPIVKVNEPAEAPVPASVIAVAASSAIVSDWATAVGVTFSVRAADAACAGRAESRAVSVTANAPDCAGVPLSAPADESVTPTGSAPEVTVQVYGAKPPTAPSVAP